MNSRGAFEVIRHTKHVGANPLQVCNPADLRHSAPLLPPYLLIFEDLDSLIGDSVKSFFLNEVDGFEDNDGLMMIGSTNYLERLDARISKRPGRFDRKYHFSLPEAKGRAMYCEYWRCKLASADNDLSFPDHLSGRIAEITAEFPFTYIKEAFVTSLLTIVGAQKEARTAEMEEKTEGERKDEIEKVLLRRVMKKQIENLRVEMEGARKSAEGAVDAGKAAPKGGIACDEWNDCHIDGFC